MKVASVPAGWGAEPPPTLKECGLDVSCVARQFGLSDAEFDRYLNIGLIKIAPVDDLALGEITPSFTVQLGNKVLTVAFQDGQPTGYTMCYLRGKNSGSLSCR